MPTPVSAARQCLTEEAARALDDAVAVARRRGHAQTTSLHAVSALLSLPSSALREACARARSSAYSPRLQFRALELSVGVSLDRLPSSKASSAAAEEPPVSNSLMAAIKRSQANQRRHPDSFQFHHQMLASVGAGGPQAAAPVLRVEMKHFVLSILDDPIVSRVFGEAGFRSCDIKIAILHPPVRQLSPYGRGPRLPPVFLCNLTDHSDLSSSSPTTARASGFGIGFGFPFSRGGGGGGGDENSRRIGEVLAQKIGRNPLLLGVCAGEAMRGFVDGLRGGGAGIVPPEIGAIAVMAIESEVVEFVGGVGEERLGLRLEEAAGKITSGGGVLVSFGDLKELVGEGAAGDRAGTVVSRLKSFVERNAGKAWLIGSAASFEVYSKFTALFPSAEKDWDLHILPITSSSKASSDGPYSKSSLMGSFVPFGGFFAAPSELKSPCSSTNTFTRCLACTERYEHEVASVLKPGSTLSVANPYSENLPSLVMAEIDDGKAVDVMKAKDGRTTLSAKISELHKKWNEICQSLNHTKPCYKSDIFRVGPMVPSPECSQGSAHLKESSGEDSGKTETRSVLPSSCSVTNLQRNFSSGPSSLPTTASDAEKLAPKGSESCPIEIRSPGLRPRQLQDMNLPPDDTLAHSTTSVTTDLGLGTIYTSPLTNKEPCASILQDPRVRPQHSPNTHSIEYVPSRACASRRLFPSSPCTVPSFKEPFDPRDVKSFKRALFEKVGRQDEAVSVVSQALCYVRSGGGRNRGSNLRQDVWVMLLGPDKVGKKRIAAALAEMLYGSRESLISVDLGCQNRGCRSSLVFQDDDDYDMKFRGKTVVDYLAGELSRKHHSVVFLENIDKADVLAQNSLSQAIKTGKFRDSRGREISISNTVFITTTTTMTGNKTTQHTEKEPIQFPEDAIVEAKKYQMQIVINSSPGDSIPNLGVNVRIAQKEEAMNSSSVNKRKLIDTRGGSAEQALESQKRAQKASRSFLDLNVPVEETEEESDVSGEYDSDSVSETSEAWLEDFLDQIDEKVALKPFNFDTLSRKILGDININFKRILGPEASLVIDYDAMVQILGAAWLSEEKLAVEDWISRVLCRGFAEAEHKFNCKSRCVLRLVASKPLVAEEQASCVCLPARISLN